MKEDLKLFESAVVLDDSSCERSKVEFLVLQLASILGNEPSSVKKLPSEEQKSEIILEIKIEGVNYTLARHCSESHNGTNCLSPREKEIARLIAKGHANKTIAEILEISPYTVATHIRRMFNKLNVNSRAEMIAIIINNHGW